MARTRLGMLTPSSNTVLEPLCAEMLQGVPDVSAHFARFRVTEIALDRAALDQFALAPMLEAAALLADAHVDAICWNGTSAGWLGFERDRALSAAIAERFGVPAASAVLALAEIFRLGRVRRFGLVSPYLPEIQDHIIANFRSEGFACVAERHLAIRDNFAFADVPPDTLAGMIRECAGERPDAITILCTNLRGAPLVEGLERELGLPIFDSTAAALWASLRAAKIDPAQVRGWGRLFRAVA
ncbi:MAG TPA: aspartate/glutamate racemase family protein [Stellaceae bacterium]|nr:aspartate/glutamate racemase family protein [Stellaceae bacterium]